MGELPGGQIELQEGQPLTIGSGRAGGARRITTTHLELLRDVRKGDRVLLDDGTLELWWKPQGTARWRPAWCGAASSDSTRGSTSRGEPECAGGDGQGPADLAFGIELGVDYVALSFVRRPGDIEQARRAIARHGVKLPVIAKLEKAEAIKALDEILTAADGVMVARGDLGVKLAPNGCRCCRKRSSAKPTRPASRLSPRRRYGSR